MLSKKSLLLALGVLAALFQVSHFAADVSIGHNALSNLLPAFAEAKGFGVPYRDYWDIYPPGIFIFWSPLSAFFLKNLALYKCFHFFLNVIAILLTLRLLQYSWWISLAFLISFASLEHQTHLLSNTLIATVFTLVGMTLTLRPKPSASSLGLAGFALAAAGSMKEPFLFGLLVPLFLEYRSPERTRNQKLLSVGAILFGAFLVFAINWVYLWHYDLIATYWEVVQAKRSLFFKSPFDLFAPNRIFGFIHELFQKIFMVGTLTFGVFFWMTFRLMRNYRKSGFSKKLSRLELGVLLFWLTQFMGFNLQHRVGGTYTLQMIPATFVVLSVLYQAQRWRPLLFPLMMLSILPASIAFQKFVPERGVQETLSQIRETQWWVPSIPPAVKEVLKQDNRIVRVYGWGAPHFYFSTDTRPYTRFFIVHSNIMGDAQKREWALSFLQDPPKVIQYENGPGADMNVEAFESVTLQLKHLIDECYTEVESFYLLNPDECPVLKNHPERFFSEKMLQTLKNPDTPTLNPHPNSP